MTKKDARKGKEKVDMVSKTFWNKKASRAHEEAESMETERPTIEVEDRRKASQRGVLASGRRRAVEARGGSGVQDEYPPHSYGLPESTLSLNQAQPPRPYGFDASRLNLDGIASTNWEHNHTPTQQQGLYYSTPELGSGVSMYAHHLWQPQAVRSHPIPFVQHNLATLTPSPYVQQTWGSSPAQNPTPAPSVIPPRTWVSSLGYSPTPSPPAPLQTQVSATEHTSTQPPATEHTSTQPPPVVAPQHMSNHSPSVTNQQQPDQLVNMDNGAPIIGDVLTDYGTHYARVIWSDPEHKKLLTIHRRDRTITKLRHYFNDAPDGSSWKTLVEHSGLTSLLRCQIQCVDHLLVSSFVEHWYPETNTFHLPFGEMTITLHDVFYLTGLKVDGELLRDSGGSEKKLQLDIHRAWGLSKEDINSWFSKSGLLTKKLMEQLQELIANNQNPKAIASLWIFIFIGVTLFLDKSSDRIKPKYARVVLEYIEELDTIAWGTCALALLYRQLGEASRAETKQMSSFGALLHMWI